MRETVPTRYVVTIDLPIEDAHLATRYVRRDQARRATEAALRGDRRLARFWSAVAAPFGCEHPPGYRSRVHTEPGEVEACDLCGTITKRQEPRHVRPLR